jgi:mannose-6-phosphate isomerase
MARHEERQTLMEAAASERPLARILLALDPQFRERVWGGQHLRTSDPPIGEAWVAFGESVVSSGPLAGRRLADLAAEHGAAFLGSSVADRFGPRFPLLVKLLDCADWLSVQVHPNDEQAGRMVGPDEFGKTEAWFFLETAPDARILVGVRPGTTTDSLAAAIREGRVVDVAAEIPVHGGEAILVPAGTLHALGPSLLLYEIQQAGDITYRAYDWGRPQSAGRKLHIEESVAVTTTDGPRRRTSPTVSAMGGIAEAVDCAYFHLDLARIGATPIPLDTGGRSFHIVTVAEGAVELSCGSETVRLGRFGTALVAGAAGAYEVRAAERPATFLRALVPD